MISEGTNGRHYLLGARQAPIDLYCPEKSIQVFFCPEAPLKERGTTAAPAAPRLKGIFKEGANIKALDRTEGGKLEVLFGDQNEYRLGLPLGGPAYGEYFVNTRVV